MALPLGGLDRLALSGRPRALPDGRHVLVGGHEPDTYSVYLKVVDANGDVEIERRVEEPGEEVALLAATSEEAILGRTGDGDLVEIVAHDLETGDERFLFNEHFPFVEKPGELVADTTGDDLAVAFPPTDTRNCRFPIFDSQGGRREVAHLQADCEEILALRFSPTGGVIAVVYRTAEELRVMTASLHGGSGSDFGFSLSEAAGPDVEYLGIAWDHTTIQFALLDLTKVPPDWPKEGSKVPDEALIIDGWVPD